MVDNRPFDRISPGGIALIGSMGEENPLPGPDRRYMDSMPLGACDPADRIAHCDKEGLDGVVLYPTIGLVWPCAVEDPELADAYARAYNRWLADFCRDSRAGSSRSLSSVCSTRSSRPASCAALSPTVAAPASSSRSRGTGFRTVTRISTRSGQPPRTSACRSASTPATSRASPIRWPGSRTWTAPPASATPARSSCRNMAARIGVQQAFSSFFAYSTLERFPGLRLGVLESGAGWIGSFLDRMDALVGETIFKRFVSLSLAPSEYFRRQCFISCDPDETAAPLVVDHVGAECFLWATDYPHPDHPADWQRSLQRMVEPLSAETTAKVAGDNAIRLYGVGTG